MSTAKKNGNNNGKKTHDVAGILCIIISLFFLICLITPLLSDIGVFIKSLLMGLVGYLCYPIILCTLFIGVMLLMDKRPALSTKQIVFIALMAVAVVFILQTAIDAGKMSGTFGEYFSTLISFDASNTEAGRSVGGIIFGILAYAFKSALTFVGAYILYCLMLVIFAALLVLDLRNDNPIFKSKQKKHGPTPFVKGQSEPQPVRSVNDTSLFVGTIAPNNRVDSESGSFSSISDPWNDNVPRYESAQSQPVDNSYGGLFNNNSDSYSNFNSYNNADNGNAFGSGNFFNGNNSFNNNNGYNTNNGYNLNNGYNTNNGRNGGSSYNDAYSTNHKEQAKKILYGDQEEMLKAYENRLKDEMNIRDRKESRSNYLIDDNDNLTKFFQPYTFTSSPDISPAPSASQKSTEETIKNSLPDIAVPPTKDVSDQFVEGPILNGDEFSKSIEEINKKYNVQPTKPQEVKEKEPELPPIVTGNPNIKSSYTKREESPFAASYYAQETKEKEPELPPIIFGDSAYKKEEPVVKEQPVVSEQPVIKEQPAVKEEPIEEKTEVKPILNGDVFVKNEEPTIEDDDSVGYVVFRDEPVPDEDTAIEEDFEPQAEPITEEPEEAESDGFDNFELDIGDDDTDEAVGESYMEAEYKASESEEPVVDRAEEAFDEAEEPQIEEADEASYADSFENDIIVGDEEIAYTDEEEPITEDETSEEEPTIEAKIPDSLKLIDEEIDMSEKGEEILNDNTGYYVNEGFNKNVSKISLKLKDDAGLSNDGKDHNQINMNDYDVEIEEKPKKQKKNLRYTPPPIDLLVQVINDQEDNEDYEKNANDLEEVLRSLKVDAKVKNITKGPAVTRYELEMGPGQTVKRMPSYAEDIAYSLATSGKVRVQAPVTGKKAVGVEVPNKVVSVVSLREIIETKEFKDAKSCLTLALGKDIEGKVILCDLEKMPHLLIAGATGSGKSACLNSIIISMLYKASPDDVRLILIDPKQVEFVLYREMPHLLLKQIINDSTQAINAFKWAREEMERRYTMFAKYAVRNLTEFNESQAVKTNQEVRLPRVVIIVDELAELMISKNSKELEQNLMSMAQKARAAGMHLILATQRPSVDVLTGTIKANLPSRIAFAVKSQVDSRTILDYAGAEALLGRGDMLYAPTGGTDSEQRVQGAFITTEEVENIVNFVKSNNETDFDEEAADIIMKKPEENIPVSDEEKGADTSEDPLMKDVLRRVIETNQASASQIQRKFAVGYNRASRIIDQMEENGYIGPLDGAKPREVYITREKFIEIYGEDV